MSHLYVLIPVLDDDQHYWVGEAEIEKLLHHGQGWLAHHPAKEQITNRYLKRRRKLSRIALTQLAEADTTDPQATDEAQAAEEAAIKKTLSLNQQRLETVSQAISLFYYFIDNFAVMYKIVKALNHEKLYPNPDSQPTWISIRYSHRRTCFNNQTEKTKPRYSLGRSLQTTNR